MLPMHDAANVNFLMVSSPIWKSSYIAYNLHVCLQLVEFICLDSWSGTSIIDWSTGGARSYIILPLTRDTNTGTLKNYGTLCCHRQLWYILVHFHFGKFWSIFAPLLVENRQKDKQTKSKVSDKSHKRNTLMLPTSSNKHTGVTKYTSWNI